MKAFVVAISCLFVAAPAFAQSSTGGVSGSGAALSDRNDLPESTGPAGNAAGGERRICRRVETESSSRMASRRICRTAQEWRDAQRER